MNNLHKDRKKSSLKASENSESMDNLVDEVNMPDNVIISKGRDEPDMGGNEN